MYVTSGSHFYVCYSSAQRKLLKTALPMKEVKSPPTSVLLGRGHVCHAANEGCKEQCTQDRSSLAPESHELPDPTGADYGDSIAPVSEKNALLQERGAIQQKTDSTENALKGYESDRPSNSEKASWNSLRSC